MTVDAERMLSNLELTHGAPSPSGSCSALVAAWLWARDEAYRVVQ